MPRASKHRSHRSHKHRDRSESESEETARVRVSRDPDSEGEGGRKRKERWEKVESFGGSDVEKVEKGKGREESKKRRFEEVRREKEFVEKERERDRDREREKGHKSKRERERVPDGERERDRVSEYCQDKLVDGEKEREKGGEYRCDKSVDVERERDKVADYRHDKKLDGEMERDRVAEYRHDKSMDGEKERDRVVEYRHDKKLDGEKERDKVVEYQRDKALDGDKERDRVAEYRRDKTLDGEKERDRVVEYRRDKTLDGERDKGGDYRRDRSSDVANQSSRTGSTEGEMEANERKPKDKLFDSAREQEKQKLSGRSGFSERDRKGRDSDDRKSSFTDDQVKSGKYKDERYKDKYQEDFDKDRKHYYDESHRDRRSSRHHSRSESKHTEPRSESRLHGYDREDHQSIDKYGVKHKDGKERRSFVEKEEHSDPTFKASNLPHSTDEQNMSNKYDKHPYGGRGGPVISPSKGNTRHQVSLTKERNYTSSASSEDFAGASGVTNRVPKSQSDDSRAKPKDYANTDDVLVLVEDAAASPHRQRRPETRSSPVLPAKRSPSRDRQYSKRSNTKDRRGYSPNEEREHDFVQIKPSSSENSQIAYSNHSPGHGGMSSSSKTDRHPSSSPGHLLAPTPSRHGTETTSVLGSFEDHNRMQSVDRKSSGRYKRPADLSIGRGQGNTWRGVPNWHSPVANGFMPYQQGPPQSGFPPYPPPMYGMRPYMDMNHRGIPYHMHDSCPPHFPGWDGGNPVFGDDPHMYGRLDWEQKRQLVGNRAWETNSPLGEQKENLKFDGPVTQAEPAPVDETQTVKGSEVQIKLEDETKQVNDTHSQSVDAEAGDDLKDQSEKTQKTTEPSALLNDMAANFCGACLSKLDISDELTQPELRKKCTDFVGSRPAVAVAWKSRYAFAEDANLGLKVAVKNSRQARRPLFPQISDDVYKKTTSLYKRVAEAAKVIVGSSILKMKEDSPKILLEETTKEVENSTSTEDALPENVDPVDMEEDANDDRDAPLDPIINVAGDEKPHDDVPTTVNFPEVSTQRCEGLITECLSRIPYSPESTH